MQVATGKIVMIDFNIANANGQILDTSKGVGPLVYMHGSAVLVPGLEAALTGKSPGDFLHIVLAPDQAYGIRDPKLVRTVARKDFAAFPNVLPGMQFEAMNDKGQTILTSIRAVTDDTVTIDTNHPLAGQTLSFDVTVLDVREPTEEELARSQGQ